MRLAGLDGEKGLVSDRVSLKFIKIIRAFVLDSNKTHSWKPRSKKVTANEREQQRAGGENAEKIKVGQK